MKKTKSQESGIAIQGNIDQSLIVSGNGNVIQFSTSDNSMMDFSARIQNFFFEYLGTSEEPAPFGGRELEMDNLDSWLEDEEHPYLLLASAAGRGKSALLVRWRQELISRKDLIVIFIPISIRFRTNLAIIAFTAIVAHLSRLYGEEKPDLNRSVEELRNLVTEYLRRPLPYGHKMLLIVDAIDEAADWNIGPDLFPYDIAKGIHVLVSARYLVGDNNAIPWLCRLGWDDKRFARIIELSLLNIEEVADVLNQMGFPLDELSKRIDIISELYRLSGGDPLLVRLYVEDLWSKGKSSIHIKPEELALISPGLDGYFDRWWEDQKKLWGKLAPFREPATRELLNLLSCAMGPLTKNDIFEIGSPKIELDTWIMEEALVPLSRFIIGDGVNQGYVFSHPKLASHLYDKLSPIERERIESRFMAWGKKTLKLLNEGKLKPEMASHYIIQYYGAHLERLNGGPDELLSLVSNGWRQAWEKFEGNYQGFLNDIMRAWKAAEWADRDAAIKDISPIYLGDIIYCALCVASINSLSANIPISLLNELIINEIWSPTQGIAIVRQIPNPARRSKAFLQLYLSIKKVKKYKSIEQEILFNSISAIAEISNENERMQALSIVIPYLPGTLKTQVVKKSIEELMAINDDWRCILGLSNIARYLPEDLLRYIYCVVRNSESKSGYTNIISKIAEFLPQDILTDVFNFSIESNSLIELSAVIPFLPPNLTEKAFLEINKTDISFENRKSGYYSESKKAEALYKIIPRLPEHLLENALKIGKEIRNCDEIKAKIMLGLSLRFQDSKNQDLVWEALRVARSIEPKRTRTMVLLDIALASRDPLKAEVLNEVIATAMTIHDIWIHDEYLALSLINYSTKGAINDSLQSVRKIKDNKRKAEIIPKLAPFFPEDEKRQLIEEALLNARGIRDDDFRIIALCKISPYLSDTLRTIVFREAIDMLKVIRDEYQINDVLTDIIPSVPNHLMAEIMIIISQMSNEQYLGASLSFLIPFLPDNLLELALDKAKKITNEAIRAEVLRMMASNVPKHLIGEYLGLLRSIEVVPQKAELLIHFAQYSTGSSRKLLLKEALKLTEEVKIDYYLEAIKGQYMGSDRSLRTSDKVIDKVRMNQAILMKMEHDANRVEIISKLCFFLQGNDKIRAIEEAIRTIRQMPQYRRKSWIAISPHLTSEAKEIILQEAIDSIDESFEDISQLGDLSILASSLSNSLMDNFLLKIRKIKNDTVRALLLSEIVSHLYEPLKPPVAEETFSITKKVRNEESLVSILYKIMPYISLNLINEAFLLITEIQNQKLRAKALDQFIYRLNNDSSIVLKPILEGFLRQMAFRERKDLLSILGSSAPIIFKLGGMSALEKTFCSIKETGLWWP